MMPFISFSESARELCFELESGAVRVPLMDSARMAALCEAHGSEFEGGVLFSSDVSAEAEEAVHAALALRTPSA